MEERAIGHGQGSRFVEDGCGDDVTKLIRCQRDAAERVRKNEMAPFLHYHLITITHTLVYQSWRVEMIGNNWPVSLLNSSPIMCSRFLR